jgi:hypothetical protein
LLGQAEFCLSNPEMNMPINSKVKVVVAVVAIASVTVLTAKRLGEPPCGVSRLSKLRIGMDESQVKGILGAPSKVDETYWVYSSSINPGWTAIQFDQDQKLLNVDAEGAWGAWSLSPED